MKCPLTFMVLSPGEKAIVTSTDTFLITAGTILALQSNFHLLFHGQTLDGFTCPLNWQRLPQDSSRVDLYGFAVNCTCTLLGTLEELVAWAVCSLHPAACCKASKHTLLSSDFELFALLSLPCFIFQIVLGPIWLLYGEWQLSIASFAHSVHSKTISVSQQGKDDNGSPY